jgi:hypothetical protein
MMPPLGILNIEQGTAEFLIIHHEEHEGSKFETLHALHALHGERLSGISSAYI